VDKVAALVSVRLTEAEKSSSIRPAQVKTIGHIQKMGLENQLSSSHSSR